MSDSDKTRQQLIEELQELREQEAHNQRMLEVVRRINRVIAQQNDPLILAKNACECLTETMGYLDAWILLLNSDEQVIHGVESQIGPIFDEFLLQVKQGETPRCVRQTLQEGFAILTDPETQCSNCPLCSTYQGRSAYSIVLHHQNDVYGLLLISVPAGYIENEVSVGLFQDISENLGGALYRLDVEAQKQESDRQKRLFAEIVAHSSISMAFVDCDYRYKAVNGIYSAYYNCPVKEIIGRRVSDFFDPKTFETTIKPYFDRCLNGESVSYQEWVPFTPTESNRYMLMHYVPYRDADGTVQGVMSYGHDLTEKQLAEDERFEQFELTRNIMKTSPIGIIVVNKDGRITYVNETVENYLGLSNSDITKRTLNDSGWKISDVSRKPFPQSELPFNIVMKTGKSIFNVEHSIETPDGRRILLSINASPLKDRSEEIAGAVMSISDITTRKHTETALREREERLRALFDHAADAIYVIDLEGRLVQVNERACQWTGYDSDKMLGMYIAELDALDPDHAKMHEMIASVQEKGKIRTESLHRHLDGSTYPVEITWSLMKRESTSLILGIARDIGKRKQAEKALEKSERRVRKKLESIISPESDISDLELSDIIDSRRIQATIEDFYHLTGIGIGIIDNKGKILVAVGWQDICTKFHRVHPETCKKCIESDLYFASMASQGEFYEYHCKNNLWDIATPIEVSGKRLGALYLGQFFYEDEVPDVELFRQQARKYGFDEEEYVAALERVPRWSRETVQRVMRFYMGFASLFSNLGYSSLKLARTLEQRTLAEKVAHENEARFRTVYEHMAIGIAHVSLDFVIEAANTSYCNMLGYTEEELIGKHLKDITHPESLEENLRKQQELAQGLIDHFQMEKTFITKDGRLVHGILDANLIRDESGKPSYFLGSVLDISERKQALETLRESEEKFKAIASSANDAIILQDSEGLITYWNPAAETLFGYTSEEMIGKDPHHVLMPEKYREQYQIGFQQFLKTGTGAAVGKAVELTAIHKTGMEFPIEISVAPVDMQGSYWATAIIKDITERKQLQQQLQQSQKMESVGRLAGGVAHDFNNLLTSITGNVALAMMDISSGDPLLDTLGEINQAAESATNLTRQLLAFSRKQIIKPKVIDLHELIGNMHKMLKRLIGEDIDLQTLRAEKLECIKADPGQMEQILVNLAVNARDAMPNGGKLTIEIADTILDEAFHKNHPDIVPGEYVVLAVSDNGEGMSEETKRRVFDPFYTTKAMGEGTGLGLAMVYGIVKQHDGHILVDSQLGKGTTFKVYFPRVEEPGEIMSPKRRTADLPEGTETVLVVEDEPMVRNIAIRILKRQGYKVRHADSGGNALSLVRNENLTLDLLMTDIVMPHMNGRELAEELKAVSPELKILFTSGYTEDVIAHHGVLDEGLDFIAKPYSPQDLAKKVREVLDS